MKNELERYKILSGALVLRRFTTSDLAHNSGLDRKNVKCWIKNLGDIIKEDDRSRASKEKGSKASIWWLTDDAIDRVRTELVQLWPNVSDIVLQKWRAYQDKIQPESLITAEAYLDAAAKADEVDEIRAANDYRFSAQAWLRAAKEEVSECQAAGIDIPNKILKRIATAEAELANFDSRASFGTLCNFRSVTEYSNWLLDSLSTWFESAKVSHQLTESEIDEALNKSILKTIEEEVADLSQTQSNLLYCSLIAAFGSRISSQYSRAVRTALSILMQRNHEKIVSGLQALISDEKAESHEILHILIGLSESQDIVLDDNVHRWLETLRKSSFWRPDFAPAYFSIKLKAPKVNWSELVASLQSDLEQVTSLDTDHSFYDCEYQSYDCEYQKKLINFARRTLKIKENFEDARTTATAMANFAASFSTDAFRKVA